MYVEMVVTASDSDQHPGGPVRARQESVGQCHQVHGDITAEKLQQSKDCFTVVDV